MFYNSFPRQIAIIFTLSILTLSLKPVHSTLNYNDDETNFSTKTEISTQCSSDSNNSEFKEPQHSPSNSLAFQEVMLGFSHLPLIVFKNVVSFLDTGTISSLYDFIPQSKEEKRCHALMRSKIRPILLAIIQSEIMSQELSDREDQEAKREKNALEIKIKNNIFDMLKSAALNKKPTNVLELCLAGAVTSTGINLEAFSAFQSAKTYVDSLSVDTTTLSLAGVRAHTTQFLVDIVVDYRDTPYKHLRKIPPLNKFTQLRSLDLLGTKITSFSGITNWETLESLRIGMTPITSLRGIKPMPNLSFFDLFDADDLLSLEYLTVLPKLKKIWIPYRLLFSIVPYAPKLEYACLSTTPYNRAADHRAAYRLLQKEFKEMTHPRNVDLNDNSFDHGSQLENEYYD